MRFRMLSPSVTSLKRLRSPEWLLSRFWKPLIVHLLQRLLLLRVDPQWLNLWAREPLRSIRQGTAGATGSNVRAVRNRTECILTCFRVLQCTGYTRDTSRRWVVGTATPCGVVHNARDGSTPHSLGIVWQ